MGARASVVIKNDTQESPVLCQHWGGEGLHEEVREWIAKVYSEDHSEDGMKPANRIEPDRLFVRLVQKFGEGGYIVKDRSECDDSDYGCLFVDVSSKDKPKFSVHG
jgi:hypothetical protein